MLTCGYPLVFTTLEEHLSASPHQLVPGTIYPAPRAWHGHGLMAADPPQGAVGNHHIMRVISWQFIPQPLSPHPWRDTGARGTGAPEGVCVPVSACTA